MIVNELTIKRDVRFLWLKNVIGVDLNTHCAKCLIGDYVKGVKPSLNHYEKLTLSDGTYYLCGVAIPFDWAANIHLAFEYCKGARLKVDNEFYTVDIEDARLIEISKDNINPELRKAKFKTYNTCRNWWFANWYEKNK